MAYTHYRTNENIRAEKVRLIDGGENPVLGLTEAVKRARESGMTLVEISEKTDPPVVKIVDFQKFLYEQKQRLKKQARSVKKIPMKELRFSLGMGDNDLNLRIERAKEFLKGKHQLKLTMAFRGREVTHSQLGIEKLNKVIENLSDLGKMEGSFKRIGRFISVLVIPK